MYLVPEKFSLSARKWGKGLKSNIEGKFEDYLPPQKRKTSYKFYFFTPFSNEQVLFFSQPLNIFPFQIKFTSLLAGSLGHPLLNLPARCNYNKPLA